MVTTGLKISLNIRLLNMHIFSYGSEWQMGLKKARCKDKTVAYIQSVLDSNMVSV